MVWLLRNWYKSSRHGTSSVNVLRSDLLVGRSSSELDKILSRVLLLSLRLLPMLLLMLLVLALLMLLVPLLDDDVDVAVDACW